MSDHELIEAFHVMWGNFPEPTTLVHKSRKILAVNKACRALGMEAGMNCAKFGPPESHRGCLANQALRSQQPAYRKVESGGKEIISYWLPVEGWPEIYVHFGIGVLVDYTDAPKNLSEIAES